MQFSNQITLRNQQRTPCSFAELMELYEANYLRLRLLLPDLKYLNDREFSEIPDYLGLHLQVLERAKYTTTLMLFHRFSDAAEPIAPHTQIRMYHDARIAEAMAPSMQQLGTKTSFSDALQVRWRRNRFLHRWLGYCLRRGYRFRYSDWPDETTDVCFNFQLDPE